MVHSLLSLCKSFLDAGKPAGGGTAAADAGAAAASGGGDRLRVLILVSLANLLGHPVLCRAFVNHKDCVPLVAAHLLAIPDAKRGGGLSRCGL